MPVATGRRWTSPQRVDRTEVDLRAADRSAANIRALSPAQVAVERWNAVGLGIALHERRDQLGFGERSLFRDRAVVFGNGVEMCLAQSLVP